jgi:diaminohydroxyphosphoribosylaminopyrimidine deaminase / 5-amino-6-(5-phosphoribosylamino)uracil reductase
MRRAIALAELGRGSVSPNPMVGCVIVHEDRVIGEGYHQRYGEAHAEPNAIASVKESHLLSEATVYVTLEPCAHFGKTPPCANLLVEKRVKKVVIGALDTNPLVGGKGIEQLKNAGIEVITGVLEGEIQAQNTRFFTFMEKRRPYILLKWAQTRDGYIARGNYDSKWISNPYSRQMVHQWRAQEDAIMVGTNTAQYDNPQLNVREWSGKNPVRIVIDKNLRLDKSLVLFDQTQETLVYNTLQSKKSEKLEYIKLGENFEVKDILEDLYQRKIQSVLVEGGSYLLNQFIEKELWDEARVFTGNVAFGDGIKSPKLSGKLKEQILIGDDILEVWKR